MNGRRALRCIGVRSGLSLVCWQIMRFVMLSSALQRAFTALALAAFLLPGAQSQTTSPNADIMRMIQAGLPEAVVIDKINAGAGHWDSSIDALITLKAMGATPGEMKALTEATAAPARAAGGPAGAAAAARPLPGKLLKTPAGDPYLQFPGERTQCVSGWDAFEPGIFGFVRRKAGHPHPGAAHQGRRKARKLDGWKPCDYADTALLRSVSAGVGRLAGIRRTVST